MLLYFGAPFMTNDILVVNEARNCTLLMFGALVIHMAGMCTEGIILAYRRTEFLIKVYALNGLLVLLGLRFSPLEGNNTNKQRVSMRNLCMDGSRLNKSTPFPSFGGEINE